MDTCPRHPLNDRRAALDRERMASRSPDDGAARSGSGGWNRWLGVNLQAHTETLQDPHEPNVCADGKRAGDAETRPKRDAGAKQKRQDQEQWK